MSLGAGTKLGPYEIVAPRGAGGTGEVDAARQDEVQSAAANRRFGYAWVAFALAFGLHFTDEATHDFLAFYNPNARAIRERLPFLPVPTFTFPVWLSLLIAAFVLLLCLSPFAFRGNRGLRVAAWPLGVLVGIANATLHISSSIYYHRWMPGVYSSPLLLSAAIYLLVSARTLQFRKKPRA